MIPGLVHICTIQKRARKQKVSYSDGSGTPALKQTVTGGTSKSTGIIDALGTGYLVLKTLTGSFAVGETITTTTWSGKVTAQEDHTNQSGEYQYAWADDQTGVPCRFYWQNIGQGAVVHEAGEIRDQRLKVIFPSSVTISQDEYRVVSSITGYTGTFRIARLLALTGLGGGIHHYEANLDVIP